MPNALNVLLVEDDEVDIVNFQRALKKNNITYRLQISRNGVEALELLSTNSEPPQIIILDINMPKMGGIELLRSIRQTDRLKRTIALVLTTSNEENDKIAAYELNVAGYFIKPLSFEEFTASLAIIHSYLQLCVLPAS